MDEVGRSEEADDNEIPGVVLVVESVADESETSAYIYRVRDCKQLSTNISRNFSRIDDVVIDCIKAGSNHWSTTFDRIHNPCSELRNSTF